MFLLCYTSMCRNKNLIFDRSIARTLKLSSPKKKIRCRPSVQQVDRRQSETTLNNMGNCLFDSLNVFIRAKSAHQLRSTLCNYVREHPDMFTESILANGYSSVDEYLEKMSQNGRDGDHTMVCAAALAYNLDIHVQMPKGRVFTESPAAQTVDSDSRSVRKTAHLRWVPGHYSVPRAYYRQNSF